jgi:hypothetical protein
MRFNHKYDARLKRFVQTGTDLEITFAEFKTSETAISVENGFKRFPPSPADIVFRKGSKLYFISMFAANPQVLAIKSEILRSIAGNIRSAIEASDRHIAGRKIKGRAPHRTRGNCAPALTTSTTLIRYTT